MSWIDSKLLKITFHLRTFFHSIELLKRDDRLIISREARLAIQTNEKRLEQKKERSCHVVEKINFKNNIFHSFQTVEKRREQTGQLKRRRGRILHLMLDKMVYVSTVERTKKLFAKCDLQEVREQMRNMRNRIPYRPYRNGSTHP